MKGGVRLCLEMKFNRRQVWLEKQSSIMKKKDWLNLYYETAIPLIRKFSKNYDDYYQKLLIANDKYLELNN